MTITQKLSKFSKTLEKIGHVWIFIEIIKAVLEIAELVIPFKGIDTTHEVLGIIILILAETMSIILIHLAFKFSVYVLNALTVLIEKKEAK